MQPLTILLFATSAFFAWSMGSHYTGAVMGAAYGAGAVSLRTGLLLVAAAAVVGSVVASVKWSTRTRSAWSRAPRRWM